MRLICGINRFRAAGAVFSCARIGMRGARENQSTQDVKERYDK